MRAAHPPISPGGPDPSAWPPPLRRQEELLGTQLVGRMLPCSGSLPEAVEDGGKARGEGRNERLARHLGRYLDDWFTFLDLLGLPATNYRGDQVIRPAVVNRKVWGGNRTEAGTRAQAVLTSTLETCRRQLRSGLEYVSQALRGLAGSIFASGVAAAPANA